MTARRGEIFRGDEFDVLELAPGLVADGLGDFGIDLGQRGTGRGGDEGGGSGRGVHGVGVLVDELEDAGQGVVENIARALVGVYAETDGVGDVEGRGGELAVEFAGEESLVHRLGEEEVDGIKVRPGHGENPIGVGDQFLGERLAAELRDVDAETAEDLDGMNAGGLAAQMALTPALETVISLRPPSSRRKRASAMGLRQMFPVQMNRTVFRVVCH